MEIFRNSHLSVTDDEGRLYITVFSGGFSLMNFEKVTLDHPRISITAFSVLKEALSNPSGKPVEFGLLRPEIELNVSSDNMKAEAILWMTRSELEKNQRAISLKLLGMLEEYGITYGILYDVINKKLDVLKPVTIAQGTNPTAGEDAIVKYLDLKTPKPAVNEKGTVDYYELDLFNHVKKGDWLGEKIPHSDGIPGKNIIGEMLTPKPGKDKSLKYDSNSVESIRENGKTILRALIDGAVNRKSGKISIVDHLMLDNVDYETGNIEFDGFVTVKGTIADGFSISADKDISILGDIGIGAVGKIVSKTGSIYIKGGISGKGRTLIEAGNSVFVKYVNSCTIKASNLISIGYYALDSILHANSIVVEAHNGRTIGGELLAKTKISLRTVGNSYEKPTSINVLGFDRNALKKELDDILLEYKNLLFQIEGSERELRIYENALNNSEQPDMLEEYKACQSDHLQLLGRVYSLEEKRRLLTESLQSKGDGEISILEMAYPKTMIEIKNMQKRIRETTKGTFYAMENQLIFD